MKLYVENGNGALLQFYQLYKIRKYGGIWMIKTREELDLYLKADMMMNRGVFKKNIKTRLKEIVVPDYIMEYLKYLRKTEYYMNYSGWGGIQKYYYKYKLSKLELKLGFSIAKNVFGYGLVIPHFGTIVVGSGNHIGNYCVLHTCICITAGNKQIGDGLYCSTGARILNDVLIGDNVTVGANAVLNHSVDNNCLVVGIPASKKRDEEAWYKGDYLRRIRACEELLLVSKSNNLEEKVE